MLMILSHELEGKFLIEKKEQFRTVVFIPISRFIIRARSIS